MYGLMVFFSGCDACFMSEVKIAPLQKDAIATEAISTADWEKSLALFKIIAKSNDYLFEESIDVDGSLFYSAKGGNWYGPMMILRKEQAVIIVEVVQYAGMYPFYDYNKLKKEVFKLFSEAFGQDRVIGLPTKNLIKGENN
jgi:hypothetical protein